MKLNFQFTLLLLLILIVPSAFADTVDITIHTDHFFHKLIIRVLDVDSGGIIDTIYTKTDIKGDALATYETNRDILSFRVLVVDGASAKETQDFDEFYTNEPIVLDMSEREEEETVVSDTADTVVEEQNDTNVTEENTTEVEMNDSVDPNITGEVIAQEMVAGLGNKIYYYIGGGVLLLVCLGVGAFVMVRRSRNAHTSTSSRTSGMQFDVSKVKAHTGDLQKQLSEAEGKLKEVQDQIQSLKKVKEAEERFESAKRELEKLKGKK